MNPARDELCCRAALGYGPERTATVAATTFELGDQSGTSYGLLAQALAEQKTVIINEPDHARATLPPHVRELLDSRKLSSLIITPLIHDGKPLGLLAAE